MCGIAGEFIWGSGRKLDIPLLFPMIEVLGHRGPESAGYWASESSQTLLLHARLAFVDLEAGTQPLCNQSGSIWSALNGEIYDHRRIHHELEQAGHKLRTTCDAELIPHLFESGGVDSFQHLRGEFAFALFNENEKALYLVRDRFGIKPLFYTVTSDSVVFGSEIKSILSRPGIPRELDEDYLRQSLVSLTLPDRTWFKGVRQVRPGHFLKISPDGIEEKPYWQIRISNDTPFANIKEAGEEFRAVIDRAVKVRLDADVEIGAYLSGGLDSSTIVESMARQSSYQPKTFTISYSDRPDDESHVAREIANKLGVENIPVQIGGNDLGEQFLASLWHSEQTTPNSHGMAKFMLSKVAGQHVKAVMTGEGADEMFAGYAMFTHQQLIEARRSGKGVQDSISDLIRSSQTTPGLVATDDYRRFSRVSELYGPYPYQAMRAIFIHKGLRRFLNRDFAESLQIEDILRQHAQWLPANMLIGLEPVNASRLSWIKSELPAYLLTSLGDRPEMAHSIEGRVPFLDNDVVDFATKLPVEWLADCHNGKLVARQAMARILPDPVVKTQKNIFWTPSFREDQILRAKICKPYLTRNEVASAGIFDPGKLRLAYHALRVLPGHSVAGSRLRSLLMTALSTHAVRHMFTTGFDASIEKYSSSNRSWSRSDIIRQKHI